MSNFKPTYLKELFIKRFIISFAIPLFIIGGISLVVTLPQALNRAIHNNSLQATNISKIISVDIKRGKEFLLGVSKIYSANDTLYKSYLREIKNSDNFSKLFNLVYTLDKEGNVTWANILSNDEKFFNLSYSGITYRYKEFFKYVQDNQTPTWSETYTSLFTGERTVTIIVPFKHGYFAADIDMRRLIKTVSSLNISSDISFTILDKFGNYIYHPNENSLYKYSKIPEISKLLTDSLNFNSFKYSEENATLLGSAAQIEESGWIVISSQKYLNAMNSVIFLAGTLLILFITMFIFAFYSSISSSNLVRMLLLKVGNRAASVGKGNYDLPKEHINIKEFDTLYNSVDTMAEAVKIREKRILENQLKTEEQYKFQQRLVDSISNPIFVIENSNSIILTNKACNKNLGLNTEELINLSKKKEEVIEFKDGKSHSVLIQKAHFYQAIKDTIDVISVIDITDRLELENKLHHSEKLQAIGQLAGGIAHDVNNQLAGIMGFTELIQDEIENDSPIQDYTNSIINAVSQSSYITKQLLAFARQGQYTLSIVSLNELANIVLKILKHTISKKIKLSIITDKNNPNILADKSQVQNALLNLGINARDAIGDSQGAITIKVFSEILTKPLSNFDSEIPPGSYGIISVSDTGEGMEKNLLSRIFEPFFTTKPEGKGTGMGLAAVYGTVTTHNGFIHVKTELGKGTTFLLYFPVVDNLKKYGNNKAMVEKSVSLDKDTKNFGILIIDDEKTIRTVTSNSLKKNGFKCFTAENGAIGINQFQKNINDIKLILLDSNMPVMDGFETFGKLRSLNPDIPIILISGYADDNKIKSLMNESNCSYISKPFRLKVLLDRINQYLKMQ